MDPGVSAECAWRMKSDSIWNKNDKMASRINKTGKSYYAP